MREKNRELPIWITEIGYPTNRGDFGVSEGRQAAMLVRSYILLLAAGVKQVSWYTLADSGIDLLNDENNMGLAAATLEPKLSYPAYSVMTGFLSPRSVIREIDTGENCKAFLLTDPFLKTLLVAWAYDETVQIESGDPISGYGKLSLKIDGKIDRIYNLYGEIIDEPDDSIRLELTLSASPVYAIGSFRIITD